MASSISNLIKDFLLSSKFDNDINLLVYSTKTITFKRMLEIIHARSPLKNIEKEDILLNNYFFKHLSLHQNIKFYSNIDQINACNFLRDFNLEKDYEELKYKFFKDCDKKKWNKFEALFFLYTHHKLLIAKENFFNSLNTTEDEISNLIKDKQIFFLIHNKNVLGKIIKFFDLFIYIDKNDYIICTNPQDFRKTVLEIS